MGGRRVRFGLRDHWSWWLGDGRCAQKPKGSRPSSLDLPWQSWGDLWSEATSEAYGHAHYCLCNGHIGKYQGDEASAWGLGFKGSCGGTVDQDQKM